MRAGAGATKMVEKVVTTVKTGENTMLQRSAKIKEVDFRKRRDGFECKQMIFTHGRKMA